MSYHVIVNPAAAKGKIAKLWPSIKAKLATELADFQSFLTQKPGEATQITRTCLQKGADKIIVVGGDGTVNECINGFFIEDKLINPKAVLGLIMFGTGTDLRRTLGLTKDLDGYITKIKQENIFKVDLGKVYFQNHNNQTATRYFINTVSCGVSTEVAYKVNHYPLPFLPGSAAFFIHSLGSLIKFKNKNIRLSFNNQKIHAKVTMAVICNGNYFGGGMFVAPMAKLDDQLLDCIIFNNLSFFECLMNFPKIYQGKHLQHPKVQHYQTTKIQLSSEEDDDVFFETDGEVIGKLPITVELVPSALSISVFNAQLSELSTNPTLFSQ